MALISTAQAGNWSNTSTWSGGVVPGDGDTVEINHAVTVDVNTTVGASPAATALSDYHTGLVADVECTADLTIAEDVIFVCRGNIAATGCKIIQIAGSVFEFDASQAADPTNQNYWANISTVFGAADVYWECRGTADKHCQVRSNAAGGNGYTGTARASTNGGSAGGGSFRNTTFTDFTRIGTASLEAMFVYWSSSNHLQLTDCVFDACGEIEGFTTINSNSDCILDRVTFKNTTFGRNLYLQAANTKAVSATRLLRDVVFDASPRFVSLGDFTIERVYFLENYSGTGSVPAESITNCFFRTTSQGASINLGTLEDSVLIKDGDIDNGRWWFLGGSFVSHVRRCIFDQIGVNNADSSDTIPVSGTVAGTYDIEENIFLDDYSVPLALPGDSSSQFFNYNKNTARYHVFISYTGAASAGMITSFKDNIGWSSVVNDHYLITDDPSLAVDDLVAAANIDNNCSFNLIAGSSGNGINIPFSSGTPNPNGINADPEFVDSSRTMLTWDTSLGGNGTMANVVAEFNKINTPDHNPAYTVDNFSAYIREGFAPTNAALDGAASDGGTIGAVDYQSTTPEIIYSCTNIRDSQNIPSKVFGRILHNWLCEFYETLTESQIGAPSAVNLWTFGDIDEDGTNDGLYAGANSGNSDITVGMYYIKATVSARDNGTSSGMARIGLGDYNFYLGEANAGLGTFETSVAITDTLNGRLMARSHSSETFIGTLTNIVVYRLGDIPS